jgi:predicted phage terminase large subunit-like protein
MDIVDAQALDREIYRRSFREFVPDAFEALEGGDLWADRVRLGLVTPKFVPGWHIDVIAEHLQAVSEGHIRRLLINVPPGTMKSVLACVLWPAWMWMREPKLRFLFSSYSEEFTKRDARKTKMLIKGEWFQARFPHVKIAAVPDTQMEQHTTAGGERHGASTNSGVTGKHVHGIVEDDPLKLQDAMKSGARNEAWNYHTQALGFRLLPEGGWRVVVMQRLHEDDVSGRILERMGEDGDSYVHLCLPMEYEAKRRCVTHISPTHAFEDPRTQEGELLWPQRMNAEFVAEKKGPNGLGAYGYAGQAQQRPAPVEGGIIKRDWLRFYRELPKTLTKWWQSWDLIFDGDAKGSFCVGQVWAQDGANRYLVWQRREREDFVATLNGFVRMTNAYPQARRKKIEKKANGAALISMLKGKIPGIVPVNPHTGKEARLMAVSPYFEAGNIWLPDISIAGWVEEYVEELVTFPNSTYDDQVDATSQALDERDKAVTGFSLDLSVGARPSPWRL